MITITRRAMTQNDRYLFTKARSASLLGVKENQIEFVYVCGNGKVLVGLFNDSIYLTEQEFKVSYATERKERSKGIKITQRLDDDFTFTARNENKQTAYKVECYTDEIKCNCPDYEISTQVVGSRKVACKHIYAVLGHLGFGNLKEYLKHYKELGQQIS